LFIFYFVVAIYFYGFLAHHTGPSMEAQACMINLGTPNADDIGYPDIQQDVLFELKELLYILCVVQADTINYNICKSLTAKH
jgi:hypothetical protein